MSVIKEIHNKDIERFPGSPSALFNKWFDSLAESFFEVDRQESIILMEKIKAQRKQCYMNSFSGMLLGYEYYEGYVLYLGIPIEHAWLVKNGKVVDPTLAIKINELKDIDRFGSEYRGVNFKREYMIKRTLKYKVYRPALIDRYIEEKKPNG